MEKEYIRAFDMYVLWQFGNYVAIGYIFPRFGILCQKKSGNPGLKSSSCYLPEQITDDLATSNPLFYGRSLPNSYWMTKITSVLTNTSTGD
jgi:hypothetical protein